MYRTWHLVLVLLLQHAPTIEDSRLCFVRSDAVEEEGTKCAAGWGTLDHLEAHRILQW
jgi:hypothetical protein